MYFTRIKANRSKRRTHPHLSPCGRAPARDSPAETRLGQAGPCGPARSACSVLAGPGVPEREGWGPSLLPGRQVWLSAPEATPRPFLVAPPSSTTPRGQSRLSLLSPRVCDAPRSQIASLVAGRSSVAELPSGRVGQRPHVTSWSSTPSPLADQAAKVG